MDHALILATVLSAYIGYEKASALAKECGIDREAYCRRVLEEELLSEEELHKILRANQLA